MGVESFVVKEKDVGTRADILVSQKLQNYSRSSLKKLFPEYVTINNKIAKASYKLRSGDVVKIDDISLSAEPETIELPLLYEDDDVLVLNKPAGVLTHSKGALNTEATVASFIKNKLNDPLLGGTRAGIVHRLDRATSGVIITAKSERALKWLQKQFSTRKAKKTYLAVVTGPVSPNEAIIDAPIERNPKKPQTFRVGSQGKSAQTKYKVIKNFTKGKKNYSLLELNPQTGRTHQLRVHLKYVGHPIVGDPVYGKGNGPLMLHAKSLELTLPNGIKKPFEANPPKKFMEFIGS
ncbi:RluA family pseudouridine synthase [Candidatus Saccharibacteria bacterium]|nr:RluA family pseudouridine synthase [Candidatus Saccharibacteria bacterium]